MGTGVREGRASATGSETYPRGKAKGRKRRKKWGRKNRRDGWTTEGGPRGFLCVSGRRDSHVRVGRLEGWRLGIPGRESRQAPWGNSRHRERDIGRGRRRDRWIWDGSGIRGCHGSRAQCWDTAGGGRKRIMSNIWQSRSLGIFRGARQGEAEEMNCIIKSTVTGTRGSWF